MGPSDASSLPLETRVGAMNPRPARQLRLHARKQRASPRALRISRQPSVPADYSRFGARSTMPGRALLAGAVEPLGARAARATNISQFADSICCSIRCGQLYEGVRQRDCYTSVRLARCWAHPQLAAGRGAAPPLQIHHGAAGAPGRPPTARWLPNRGNLRASRRSCGRRRLKRRMMPHR